MAPDSATYIESLCPICKEEDFFFLLDAGGRGAAGCESTLRSRHFATCLLAGMCYVMAFPVQSGLPPVCVEGSQKDTPQHVAANFAHMKKVMGE